MPFKKKIVVKCHFCRRALKERIYTIKKDSTILEVCSACKYTFNILNEEMKSDRFGTLKSMINLLLKNKRHCSICKQFRTYEPSTCMIGRKTGMGYATCYAFSYANHGCSRFHRITAG